MMKIAEKLARYGATLALTLMIAATTAPHAAFASEQAGAESEEYAGEHAYDPSAAPFVLNTVNGGVQTAASGAAFGLGVGEAASGEHGLGIGAGSTHVGAGVADLGLGVPASALGQP